MHIKWRGILRLSRIWCCPNVWVFRGNRQPSWLQLKVLMVISITWWECKKLVFIHDNTGTVFMLHNAWGAPYGTDPEPFSLDGSLSQWQQSQPWIYNRFTWQRLMDGLAGLVWHIRWKLLAFILPVLIFDQSSEFLCSLVDFLTLAACSLPQDISLNTSSDLDSSWL